MKRLPGRVGLLVLAVLLSGCVSDRAYRIDKSVLHEQLFARNFDPTQTGAPNSTWAYKMAFLEVGDNGTLFDPAQLARALTEIKAIRDTPPPVLPEGQLRVPPMIVVFVHGWKNNASEGSGNVWGFRQTLAALSLQQEGMPTLGIYVGWRGATVKWPILKEFTFFDRHGKSQSSGEGELVGALRDIVSNVKAAGAASGDVRLVLVGHSFGGAVLEAAITPQLQKAIADARSTPGPEPRRVKWPADLIVLLNEAQEAERSYPLIEEMHRSLAPRPNCASVTEENPYKRPAVISISSRSDYATRAFFPAAQLLGRPFNGPAYNGPDPLGAGKRRLYYSTTAHLPTLQSHLIGRRNEPAIQQSLAACPTAVVTSEINMFEDEDRYLLVERPGTVNKTPYWVMWMPGSLVPDHSTIFTQVLRDYLVSLLGAATLLPPHDELKP